MIYADIGRMLHWQPSEIDDYSWDDIAEFHHIALQMHGNENPSDPESKS